MMKLVSSVSELRALIAQYPLATRDSEDDVDLKITGKLMPFGTEWAWLSNGFFDEFLRSAQLLDKGSRWCLLASSPSPRKFLQWYGRIPIILSDATKSQIDYMAAANFQLGDNEADCLATIWEKVVIASESGNWGAKFDRMNDSGFAISAIERLDKLEEIVKTF